ncbi:MAG: KH domain-containing protein [Clostridia bacterium]|nr:KH domain-containing protein [Clostridia bacterium]
MIDLIKYVVFQFAEHKDDCEFIVNEDGDNVSVNVILNKEDMGKVIGRQGKIAKALRTIVKSAASKSGKRYNIEINEKEGA